MAQLHRAARDRAEAQHERQRSRHEQAHQRIEHRDRAGRRDQKTAARLPPTGKCPLRP